jgi:hypothetical protein
MYVYLRAEHSAISYRRLARVMLYTDWLWMYLQNYHKIYLKC